MQRESLHSLIVQAGQTESVSGSEFSECADTVSQMADILRKIGLEKEADQLYVPAFQFNDSVDQTLLRIIGENKVIRNMITNIRDMPNLFIRLLFVKSIIRCAVENPQCLCKANIQCLNNYLRIRNIQYTELMQNIMKYAVVYRKEAESDGKRIRQKWIAELEKE